MELKKKNKLNRFLHNPREVDLNALGDVKRLIGDGEKSKHLLIEYLHKIQDEYEFISSKNIFALAYELKISSSEVFEVASFYHHFNIKKNSDYVPPELLIRVCQSLACEMFGAKQMILDLKNKLPENIKVEEVPCVGRCDKAPVAVIHQKPIENATVEEIQNYLKDTQPEKLSAIEYSDYIEKGGYETYKKCVSGDIDSEAVIKQLEDSGLRGLGGAGFPVGRKWRIVKSQQDPKLMAVNIDEGEPGTFKDRFYLEQDPHRFLEGMLIAARVVGIKEIYIYLRDEYAAIRELLTKEIEKLLNNPPADLPKIYLRRGAGAYICGEESAMIESIEGKRGMPRLRPPFVAEVGLFGRPTLEHNMESLYWIRDVVEKGSKFFTQHGRNGRVGLRSFSVSGRVKNPGVHLAPAGITIQELIDEYCGGMLEGHNFYGYFPGGASGGILPATLNNIPLDFDTLQEYGCFIGSAAVVIFSDQDKAKDLALNAMEFFEDESCGQCTPCRVGTAKASDLMKQEDWNEELLEELSEAMIDTSICGLGQAAPNPVRSVFKYFKDEVK